MTLVRPGELVLDLEVLEVRVVAQDFLSNSRSLGISH